MRLRNFAVLSLLALSACTSEVRLADGNTYDCVGIGEDHDPALTYKPSWKNISLAVIFAEMIVPPIVVLASEWSCPSGFTKSNVGPHIPTVGPQT